MKRSNSPPRLVPQYTETKIAATDPRSIAGSVRRRVQPMRPFIRSLTGIALVIE